MSLPNTLPHLCDITESQHVPDDIAADYDDPETLYTDQACWVQPVSATEANKFQRREQNVTHKVYFATNLGLKAGYTIVPSTGPFAGASLEVLAFNECTAGTGLLYRATVEEIQAR